jgi:hypothetical protein
VFVCRHIKSPLYRYRAELQVQINQQHIARGSFLTHLVLQSQTCELLPMHSPLTALTLTAYLFTGLSCDSLVLTKSTYALLTHFVICLLIGLLMLYHAY